LNALPPVQRAFLASLFAPSPSGDAGVEIYRRGALANLSGALAATYPVVLRLVGESFFGEAARQHALAHPSTSGNLDDYGAGFADFLAAYPHARELPYLADVAELEWAWHEVYHEADTVSLDPALLQQVPPAQQMHLGLQLAPAARLVSSAYPILRIWQAHQGEADAALAISLDDGGVDLLVLRRELEIEFVLLGAAEVLWLRELRRGATLVHATQVALDAQPAFDLPATLGRHLALGSFTALSFAALPLADEESAS